MCGQAGNKRGLRVDRIPLFVSFSRFCPVPASALLWFRLQFSFRPSGSGFRSAFSLPAPASALLSASRSRLPGPGHGPAPLLSLFAVPLGCPSWLSLLTAPPGYWARTFFSISSTMRRNALSVSMRFDTALHEWSTVAWLRPPMAAPMVVSGALVCCLARYMAIWRAWAISRVRSVELKRAKSRLRYSHTTSMMWSW